MARAASRTPAALFAANAQWRPRCRSCWKNAACPTRRIAFVLTQRIRTPEEFRSLNPNGKIPAILDPNGPNGPLALFESGAILIYLAAKTDQFMPHSIEGKYACLQWLMFQMGGVGPMFGQLGFFATSSLARSTRTSGRVIATPPKPRRLLGVLGHASGRSRLDFGCAVQHR